MEFSGRNIGWRGIFGQILSALGGMATAQGGGLDIGSIIVYVASSGVGGGVLLAIVGWMKSMMGKK